MLDTWYANQASSIKHYASQEQTRHIDVDPSIGLTEDIVALTEEFMLKR